MLKYLGLFLIAAISMALIAFAPFDGSIPFTPVEAQDVYPFSYPPAGLKIIPITGQGRTEGPFLCQNIVAACGRVNAFQNATLQNPTVRIDPAESVVDVGETFTITVMIDDADDLGGFEFTLLFVTTTVKVDSVALGDFLGSTGRTVSTVGPTIDNQAGRVSFGAWTLGSAPGPDGTGALAIVTLTTQGVGISPLDLDRVLVLDTGATHQTPIVEDGMVVAGGAPTPTPTPTATSTPTGTTTPTPTSTTTTTITPEPVIVVYPTSAPVGETFTFTGSHFTPDGLIEEWFADPDQARHLLGSFQTDPSGGFTRQHTWASYWFTGTYSYIAVDVTEAFSTSVEFEMTEPQTPTPTSTPTATATATPTSSKIYLPLVLKGR